MVLKELRGRKESYKAPLLIRTLLEYHLHELHSQLSERTCSLYTSLLFFSSGTLIRWYLCRSLSFISWRSFLAVNCGSLRRGDKRYLRRRGRCRWESRRHRLNDCVSPRRLLWWVTPKCLYDRSQVTRILLELLYLWFPHDSRSRQTSANIIFPYESLRGHGLLRGVQLLRPRVGTRYEQRLWEWDLSGMVNKRELKYWNTGRFPLLIKFGLPLDSTIQNPKRAFARNQPTCEWTYFIISFNNADMPWRSTRNQSNTKYPATPNIR